MLPPRSQSQHVFHLLAAGKTNSRQAFTLSVRSGQWGEPNSSEPGVRSGAGRESKQKLSETLPHPMEQPLLLAAPDRPGGGHTALPPGSGGSAGPVRSRARGGGAGAARRGLCVPHEPAGGTGLR